MFYIGKAPKGKFPHTWQFWNLKIPKPPYKSSLKMVGFVHFSNFLIPSEKYYNLQSCWITLYHDPWGKMPLCSQQGAKMPFFSSSSYRRHWMKQVSNTLTCQLISYPVKWHFSTLVLLCFVCCPLRNHIALTLPVWKRPYVKLTRRGRVTSASIFPMYPIKHKPHSEKHISQPFSRDIWSPSS